MPSMKSSSDSDEEYFDATSDIVEATSGPKEPVVCGGESFFPIQKINDAPKKPDYDYDRFRRQHMPLSVLPSLNDIEADFSDIQLKLPDYQCAEKISIASWGKQLLLQTGSSQLSPCTVTALDTLSTKGGDQSQPPTRTDLTANFLSSNLTRSESSHSSNQPARARSSGPQWNSANSSRSGIVERSLSPKASFNLTNDRSTPKSNSLNRDHCGLTGTNRLPIYPFEDLAAMRRKYSSAEMVIDALTSEYTANLRRNTQIDGPTFCSVEKKNFPINSLKIADSTVPPVRPPRPKKMLRSAKMFTDGSSSQQSFSDLRAPEGKSKISPTPSRANSEPVVHASCKARSKSKERTGSLKKDQPIEGVNPLSLHMMRLTQSDNLKTGSQASSTTSSDSVSTSRFERIQSKIFKADNLRAAVHKKLKAVWHRANARGQQPSKEDSLPSDGEEGTADGSRVAQIRAAHHHKGPFYFEQLKMVQDLKGHHIGAVWCAKFSGCGRLLATAGQDSIIRIWVLKSAFKHFSDMRARYCSKQEPPNSPPSRENSFTRLIEAKQRGRGSPKSTADSDEQAPASGSSLNIDPMEDAWAPFMPNPIWKYKDHTSDVLDVCWSENYFILSSSMDRTVRLWHITRSECLCRFQHIDFVTSIAFSVKDDRYFVSGSLDGKIRLWLITEKKVMTWNELDEGQLVTAVTYVKNGDLIAVGTYDGRCIFYTSDKLTYYAQIDLRRYGLKRYKACKVTGLDSYQDKLLITCNDSRIRLYDTRDLSLICKYRGFTNSSSQIRARFSHNGQFIISGSEDSMVYIWKTRTDSNTLHLHRRKDRSRRWESIKVHGAVVTSALFAPKPDVIFSQIEKNKRLLAIDEHLTTTVENLPDRSGSDKQQQHRVSICSESVNEVIVSADFAGAIYVFVNKPKVVAGSSVFLPS